jgi:uncharacterized membrane protein
MIVSIHITSKDYNTSYRGNTPILYDFVDSCNHVYTFFMIFCSWMKLNLPGMAYQYKKWLHILLDILFTDEAQLTGNSISIKETVTHSS